MFEQIMLDTHKKQFALLKLGSCKVHFFTLEIIKKHICIVSCSCINLTQMDMCKTNGKRIYMKTNENLQR